MKLRSQIKKNNISKPAVYIKSMVLLSAYTKKGLSLIPAISDQCGVFSSKNIKKYSLVLIMNNGVDVSYKNYKDRAKQLKLRKDTGIAYKSKVMIDKQFTIMNRKPKWYCLNHSTKPNLKLVHLEGGGAGWVALDNIKKGSELYFRYDKPQFLTSNKNEYF